MLVGILMEFVEGMAWGKGILLEFYLEKELYVSNTWFKREQKRKVTFSVGENEIEIDFVLIKKQH